MVDAALIELEGVLFDTRELRRSSLREALHERQLPTDLNYDSVDGYPPRIAAALVLAELGAPTDVVLLDLITLTAERTFSARLSSTGAALCDGARDFVREASATTRLAVVTRARRADLETMLRLASLGEFFTITICSDDVLDVKPSAAGHLLAIERLNRQRALSPKAVIALEDGAPGIRAVRDAGVRCIAVGDVPAHIAIEADAYVESLAGQTARSLDLLSRPGQERVQ